MIMLGGIGTIAGPAVGAWIVELLPQWLSGVAAISPNVQQLMFGILLIFFVLLARQGVVGQVSMLYGQALRRRAARPSAAPAAIGIVADEREREPAGVPTPRPADVMSVSGSHELNPEVVLTTKGLSHSFGANRVLNDLDFELRASEIRGLIGPNGSGKTTMLNCVSGFIRPAGGEVVFRGQPVVGRRFEKISSLGLVRTFQQPQVFTSFTPRQTCEMVLSSTGTLGGGREVNTQMPDDPGYFLELCGLTDVADISSVVLPYGQTRLLGVAAALARRPFTLMLDEPRPASVSRTAGS